MLSRREIMALIPHSGRMCLLDAAVSWDDEKLVVETSCHRDATCPLRRDGRFATVALVEPALQAMALHGALRQGKPSAPGFLGSLREVTIAVAEADGLPVPLAIAVDLLAWSPAGCSYRFAVRAGEDTVIEGEGTIAFAEPA